MKYIYSLVLILSSFILKNENKKNDCLQLDIVLVADFSGSVSGREKTITNALDVFIKRFELSEKGIKIGIITFNTYTYPRSPLTSDKFRLQKVIDSIYTEKPIGATDMVDALKFSAKEFINNGRFGYKKILILITDGYPDAPVTTQFIADQLKIINQITICGVMINPTSGNDEYLKTIASDGQYYETNFDELVNTLKKLDICM